VVTLTPDSSTAGKYLSATSPTGWLFTDGSDGYTVETFFRTTTTGARPIITLGKLSNPTEISPSLEVAFDSSSRVTVHYEFSAVTDTTGTTVHDGEWHHVAAAVRVGALKRGADGRVARDPTRQHQVAARRLRLHRPRRREEILPLRRRHQRKQRGFQ
jgi:hypothetical protein